MIPSRSSPAPKLGDSPAALCGLTDRLDRIEHKLDALVEMMKPVAATFADKGMRVAIGAAITAANMRVKR